MGGDDYIVRVCYFGTYDRNRPRNRNIIKGLKANKIEVIECHYSPWGEVEDKTVLQGVLNKFAVLVHFLFAYSYLIFRYIFIGHHDAIIVGYLGHIDVFVARPLATLRGKPIVFDALLSLYDTVVNDRKLSGPNGFIGRLSFFIDRTACRMADVVVLDTDAHIDYFVRTFQLPRDKFRRVLVGADESQFYPTTQLRNQLTSQRLKVLFYGQFIPLHGIEFIVRAAKILEKDNVEFTIIGNGQEYKKIRDMADVMNVWNINWIDWIEYNRLVNYINEADIVLGIFGGSDKAKRVIPNKVFQAIACKKPIITGDSPAARELFRDGENALLCHVGDPRAIAESIGLLRDNENLRIKIGFNGYNTYLSQCNIEAIGNQMLDVLIWR
ncbi:MAG: hypothetical protein A2132_01670 [Nitrospirae bacterium RBG_16_43_11]|nr:MAG: hypothetical protein A2132_01670 [Nitrospirae bacterium RBG_16_43_11]